ncbi:MAG: class I SAM-dependent methyltransferase [Oscillospiraceae bacterium]|nr:class I SAM-dependent methyltransferase [Oscillospiraceae bacterium]
MAYETLAAVYDRLTNDVPYEAVLNFYHQIMERYGLEPASAVDLACGTGSMALLLAKEGMYVLGVDRSEEMLTLAAEKAMELDNPPYFIRQRMEKLRLPAPVDLVVCCLDGVNYVTDPAALRESFSRVRDALRPGGLFIFDINSEAKLRGLDGQILLDEDDAVFCLWRAEFDEETRICTYGMDIFQKQGKLWSRSREEHLEYAYRTEELTQWLTEAGFSKLNVYGDRRLEAPTPDEQRIFIAAQKK